MSQNNISYLYSCIFSTSLPICVIETLFKQCERGLQQQQQKAQKKLNATTVSQAIISQVKIENGKILREFITHKFLATVDRSVDGVNI